MTEVQTVQRKNLGVLWTPEQVAKYLSVSRITIYRWIKQKKIFDPDQIVHIHPHIRIPRSEVERVAGHQLVELKNQANQL